MFDQTLIRICLILGTLSRGVYPAACPAGKGTDRGYDLLAAVQRGAADSGHLPRHRLLGRQPAGLYEPINFVYVVIIFLLLAKQFFMSIRLSQLDSKVRILTEQVALNEEKVERDKLDL